MDNGEPPVVREVQTIPRLMLALILAVAVLAWSASLRWLLAGGLDARSQGEGVGVLVAWLLGGVILPLVLATAKLTTEVRHDGLFFQYQPFHRRPRRLRFDQMRHYRARTYRPLLEYGGWGIRWRWRKRAYSVSGNRGVEMELLDGRMLLIGSQDPDRIVAAIDEAVGATSDHSLRTP